MIDNEKKHNRGVIIGFLDYLSTWITKCFCNGFFGKIFTSYDNVESKARTGLIFGSFKRKAGGRRNSIRRKLLEYYDQSLIMFLLRKLLSYFKSCKLNFFGTYLFTFGLYSLVFNFVKVFFDNGGTFNISLLTSELFWSGVLIIIASIPLLNSKKLLFTAIKESKMASVFFEKSVGANDEKFEHIVPLRGSNCYFVAILLGVLTGGISYFAGPIKVLLGMLCALIVTLIFNFPEFGVMLAIFTAPFLGLTKHPSAILATIVMLTFVSYLFKLAIGKRFFKFKVVDLIFVIFAVLILFGGILTSGGLRSLKTASMYVTLIAIYFLVSNLINSREWIERCVLSIAIPSSIVSFIGILGYATLSMPAKWIDSAMFSSITSRAIATFENPNMLATYLVLTAPFIWIYIGLNNISKKGKILAAFGTAISTACIVLTWSRGGWLGLIAGLLVFFLINSKYVFKHLILLGVTSPVWVKIIPSNMLNRFTSIGNFTDSSTYYRMYTWKGSLKMLSDHLIGGIGVGDAAFSQIYPIYSYIGNEATMHSHNLFLEVAISLGIFGLLILLVLFFMVMQNGFGCLKDNKGVRNVRLLVSAAIAGFVGALVHGMVDYIWYNYRVFFMFWVVVAVICTCANVFAKPKDLSSFEINSNNEATLDIVFEE